MNTPQSEIRKALTTANAAELQPYDLEAVIYPELQKLSVLAALVGMDPASAKTHEYTVRTSHPQGWFEGELTPANPQSATYARKSVALKIMRQWGSVSGFAKATGAKFADALALEVAASIEGMGAVVEYGLLHGCADDIGFTGDAYQFSGILPRLYKYAPTNVIDGGSVKVTLDMLDQAVAKVHAFKGVAADPKMWMMGVRMRQIVDGLQTKVSIPLTSTQLEDGRWTMRNYNGFPIYETDSTVPASTSTSPACTAVIASGGALAAATYKYQISSVGLYGEHIVGTASADCVAATTNLKSNLTWTEDATAALYIIWQKKDSGAYQLLDIIPAKTYDANGTVNGYKTSYTDDGSKTPIAIKPLVTGEQVINLINLHPQRGARFLGGINHQGEQIENPFFFTELAKVKDTYDYMIGGYLSAIVRYPNMFCQIRHVKLA